MKSQALFSSKDKSKILKCCLLQFLFGTLRVKDMKLSSITEQNKILDHSKKSTCDNVAKNILMYGT